MNRTRNLVCSGVCVFALGWMLMFLYGYVRGDGSGVEVSESKKASLPRFGQPLVKGESSSRRNDSARMDFAEYFMNIQNLRSSEDCDACFKSIIEDATLSVGEKSTRMAMLLTRWGRLTPRQALQKVLEGEDICKVNRHYGKQAWLCNVFIGWAGRDPEGAVAFFMESNDPRIRKNLLLPPMLVRSWAEHSPEDAWKWLVSQDKKSFVDYDRCKSAVINGLLSLRESDRIPKFVAGLDKQDAELYGPQLWRSWFWDHPDSPEEMAALSGESRKAALLGSISGKTRGNLEALNRELSGYNQEERQKILFDMAPGLISGDKAERERRLCWLMENAPGSLMQESVAGSLGDWFFEKRTEAKEVLDKLPAGKEKDALIKAFENTPYINIF